MSIRPCASLLICMTLCLGEIPPGLKKPHIYFDDYKQSVLLESFVNASYPTNDVIKNLSDELGLNQRKVRNWFQNQRRRIKTSKISA